MKNDLRYWFKLIAILLAGFLATLLIVLVAAVSSFATNRIAFVIGNTVYSDAPRLDNAEGDARAIADSLRSMGFDVVDGYNLDKNGFKIAFREYSRKLRTADVALLYYAGHGIQIDGENYFIPTDASLDAAEDLIFDAVAVEDIIKRMERNTPVRVVFLDSCRNNPFVAKLNDQGTSRSIDLGTGLARIQSARGTYLAYATQPGKISFDGKLGKNSPFAGALLKNITRPNVDIRVIMSDVRTAVYEATNSRQLPWIDDGLIGRFSLNVKAKLKIVAAFESEDKLKKFEIERSAWNVILNSSNPLDFIDFLENYPNGLFAPTARAQLKRRIASMPSPKLMILPASPNRVKLIVDSTKKSIKQKIAKARTDGIGITKSKKVYSPTKPIVNISADVINPSIIVTPPVLPVIAKRLVNSGKKVTKITNGKAGGIVNSSKPTRIQAAVIPDVKVAMVDTKPGPDLILSIQQNLNRIGCSAGTADGLWGSKSIDGLSRYIKKSNLELLSLDPSRAILSALIDEADQVCQIQCSVLQIRENNRCITKTCPSGKRLSSKGICYTATAKLKRSKARSKPRRSKSQKCYKFNGQLVCG